MVFDAVVIGGGSAAAQVDPAEGCAIPIAFAYAVAHYFALLVFEGQTAVVLASDPLGRGWDLFGTAGWTVNLTFLTGGQVAYIQAAAIVVGHVAAVVFAHDRASARLDPAPAARSQYPLMAAMVAYTVGPGPALRALSVPAA